MSYTATPVLTGIYSSIKTFLLLFHPINPNFWSHGGLRYRRSSDSGFVYGECILWVSGLSGSSFAIDPHRLFL